MLDSAELLGHDDLGSINKEVGNSVVSLDDESKKNQSSTGTPEGNIATCPSPVLPNSENGTSVLTSNTAPAATNAHSSSTSSAAAEVAQPHHKRQLEDTSPQTSKKLCLESPKS